MISSDDFLATIDLEKTAKKIENEYRVKAILTRHRGLVIDWLPIITYSLGLAYYGIALYAHFSEKRAKEKIRSQLDGAGKPDETGVGKKAEAFEKDSALLAKSMDGKTFDLDDPADLDRYKTTLSDEIYDILNMSGERPDKTLIDYVVKSTIDSIRSGKGS